MLLLPHIVNTCIVIAQLSDCCAGAYISEPNQYDTEQTVRYPFDRGGESQQEREGRERRREEREVRREERRRDKSEQKKQRGEKEEEGGEEKR